ncbi:hypothetical protein WJX72_005528 [[Myrmecia] bisecta]|uniref:PPM-type phosphatase domain-containing protein n=1 Tax=[Myrmecia] bisecta TaxID=41462 RepID=A0AAW1P941_9CHLO
MAAKDTGQRLPPCPTEATQFDVPELGQCKQLLATLTGGSDCVQGLIDSTADDLMGSDAAVLNRLLGDAPIRLFVGVLTAAKNRAARDAIRETWATDKRLHRVMFFAAKPRDEQLFDELRREASELHDVVVLPTIWEAYFNITHQTLEVCRIAAADPAVTHVLKVDDDSYVRIHRVLESINRNLQDRTFIGWIEDPGGGPHRDPANQWFVSEDEWPSDKYPPWAHGTGYILTKDLVDEIAAGAACKASNHTIFKLEDVAPGNAKLRCIHGGAAEDAGCHDYMQDAHAIVPTFLEDSGHQPCSFAGVYDGHNCEGMARIAQTDLHNLLAEELVQQSHAGQGAIPPKTVEAALRHTFRTIDERALAAEERHGKPGSLGGSTAVVALCMGQTLYTAHVGDSGAILARGGVAERLTEDHKPILPHERRRIEAAGGEVVQRSQGDSGRVVSQPRIGQSRATLLAMSRSLGDSAWKKPRQTVISDPDVGRIELIPADRAVILASDGIFDVLEDQEVVDIVEHSLAEIGGGPSQQAARAAADALVQQALAKDKRPDNITAVVWLLDWDKGQPNGVGQHIVREQ